jgi:signal transduction histidine kinase
MINLISNAVKFSSEDASIDISSTLDHRMASVSVRDRGIGISEEDQQHLFSSFFRGKNALNIQGTGLGLHIVKRYLELINGTIILQSRLGEGTTITFTLPVNSQHHAENNSGN